MRVVIIGAGFGGLSAAAYLAKAGHHVTIFEKNSHPGGRASTVYVPFDAAQDENQAPTRGRIKHMAGLGATGSSPETRQDDGFVFELGPSWYLMPDIFDDFFADFDHVTSDFYYLKQLVPSYKVYENHRNFTARPAPAAFMDFDEVEAGSGAKLSQLLEQTAEEYRLVRRRILDLSGLSRQEYVRAAAPYAARLRRVVGSYHSRVARAVGDNMLQHVLEFMVVFLGGSPRNIPAAYGLLSHVDFSLGIWYPMGGFMAVARAVESVASAQGVHIMYNTPVEAITARSGKVTGVRARGRVHAADLVVANADYQFVDTQLTPEPYRQMSAQAWAAKTLSPSAVLATLGVRGKVGLEHHSLFFDTDWNENFADVFVRHRANDRPLFYVCTPSKTDPRVAPVGFENMFILIPVSGKAGVSQANAEGLADGAITRIEQKTGQNIRSNIVVKNVYGPDYFGNMFNASNNNAFGLAHTLRQSGPLRPPVRSSKLTNLYFTGQFTNPGTGVPLVLRSGKVVSEEIARSY